jgi:hypothetical protein
MINADFVKNLTEKYGSGSGSRDILNGVIINISVLTVAASTRVKGN